MTGGGGTCSDSGRHAHISRVTEPERAWPCMQLAGIFGGDSDLQSAFAGTGSVPNALQGRRQLLVLMLLGEKPSAFPIVGGGMWPRQRRPGAASDRPFDRFVQRFRLILAAKDWATIFPFRTKNVSVANSYELSPVSAVQRI